MRGRKPKPAVLKIMEGNPGHEGGLKERAAVETALGQAAGAELPPPPAHLNAAGQAVWHTVGAWLLTIGGGTVDAVGLERLCSLCGRIATCEAKIQEGGLTYESVTEAGGVIVRPRPEVGILASSERELRALLVEFGLTPSSRCRIDVSKLGSGKLVPNSVSGFARKRG